MKKRIFVLLSLLLLMSISACGKTEETVEPPEMIQEESSVVSEEPQEESAVAFGTIQEESTELPEEAQEEPVFDLTAYDLQYDRREEFIKVYEQIQAQDEAENFEGTWQRSEVASSLGAELTITEQDEEGFSFIGDFYYFSHMGWLEGKALFVAPDVAIFEYTDDWGDEESTPQYVVFETTEEGLQIYASAASADLGLGMNVSVDGLYVQGEPVYTNATVLEDNFSKQVQDEIKTLLGENYEMCFETVVQMGLITSTPATLEDGTKATFYDAFIPTMGGYAFTLLACENGDLYMNSEAYEVGWKTNVEGATDYPAYVLEEE
nr:hypothetical protein [Lachnospiraceae bacterium]